MGPRTTLHLHAVGIHAPRNGVRSNGDLLHYRVLGYPTLPLLLVVNTRVSTIRNSHMIGIVAGCDDEESCPTLSGTVEDIMTSPRRTVLNSEEEMATCGSQGQPPVLERVKSKEAIKLTNVCVQEAAVPVSPVERTRLAQKHQVEAPSR